MIGQVLSRHPEMMVALSTVLSLEDLHDLIEVMTVDAHNAKVLAKRREED